MATGSRARFDVPAFVSDLLPRMKPYLPPEPEQAPNPYKSSFLLFLRDCVWTVDEARGGEVRRWPWGVGKDGKSWEEYWNDWDVALHKYPRLFVDKTRRTMASNVVVAWDLWLLAGGTDGKARWPELAGNDGNRSVLIQSKKLEGETGSQAFIAKIKRMCQHFEDRGGRELWPDFPEWEIGLTKGHFSNGSRVEAVAQGGDQVRGPGSTHIHIEEAGFMDQVQESIETAIPALAGGGHITVVTTPNANATYLKRLRAGELGARR